MFFYWSFDNSKTKLGFLDTRICPHCGGHRVHTLIKHHAHFILMIPFYWSTKYKSVCTNCGRETKINKQEALFFKKLNNTFFNTTEQLELFDQRLSGYLPEGGATPEELNRIKDTVFIELSGQYPYPKPFFDMFLDYLAQEKAASASSQTITATAAEAAPESQPATQNI